MSTEEVTAQIIHIAKQFAKENFNSKFFAAHVLKALLNQQFDFIKELDAKGIDVFYLDEWADIRISEYPKATKPSESPEADNSATLILEEAENFAAKKGLNVFPSILTAAITPGVGF
ncbi:MAG: ATP-dependent Clp protease ATP-binding subunit, partial [Flavobacterium sp.]|nr:ATP-dependent Clp protease ATP-binding subunit [Flavobacterium sp.]